MYAYPTTTTIQYNGTPISDSNPLPCSLGDGTVTITGDVNIPAVVTVYSTTSNPVHVHLVESIPIEVAAGSNTIGNVNINGIIPVIQPYQLPTGSNTIGNVNINGIIPVSLCNLPIGTYLTQQLPTGSNTIGNVNINGIIPVSFCNLNIVTYLTQQLPTGSNTIGNVHINIRNSNVGEFNPFPVKIVNPLTSKGIIKVSTPEIIFFNTFQYGTETDVWDTGTSNGGTAYFSSNLSGVTMQVTNQIGSEVIRQTRNVMRYIPGRSAELTFAIRFENPVVGIRRRIGLFNGTDGFYFEDNGGDYACVLISSDDGVPYMERIPRNQWNGDKLDGSGLSGFTASADTQQIVTFEYEWYGGGQIVFKYIINGITIIIHTINTANRLKFPWCKTPFLPIRLELTNTTGVAGTHFMYQGSNSLTNQGFTDKLGIAQSLLTPLTGYHLALGRIFYPVISIRLKATNLQGIVLPTFFQGSTIDNTIIFYKLVRNATIVGGTWLDMSDPNSFVQYNMTSTTPITDGIDLDAGIIAAGGGHVGARVALDKDTQYQIGRSNLGTISDTLTLAIAAYNSNKDVVASFTWIEQR